MDEQLPPVPASTSAQITSPQSKSYFRQLFSGRINRRTYFLGMLFWWTILAIFSGVLDGARAKFPIGVDLVMIIVYVVAITFELSLAVKRFHDAGHAGIEAILLFVPFINIYFIFWLFIKSGEKKENIYGPIPRTNFKAFIGK